MSNMQTTTPKLSNMAPLTGRMVNEEDEIHNIVDDYGPLKVVGIEHTAVHDGKSFTYAGAANAIPAGASVYFLGRTGDVTAHLFEFFIKSDQAPMTVQFFEGATVTAPGTEQTPLNRNRQLMTPSTMGVFAGSTVSADGTELILARILGDQKTVTSTNLGGEWLLKKNTDYVFKITNNSNQNANIAAGFNCLEAD